MMDILFPALYLVLLFLNLLDGISTWIFVRPDHYNREANPVARWMFRKLGITLGIILAELLWMGALTLLYFTVFQYYRKLGLVLMSLGVLVWPYIIPGNVLYCLRLRQKGNQAEKDDA